MMIRMNADGTFRVVDKIERAYILDRDIQAGVWKEGKNGFQYCESGNLTGDVLSISDGNEKTGPALCYSQTIEETCDHSFECYQQGMCYACTGYYLMRCNQITYAENIAFFRKHTSADFIRAVDFIIAKSNIRIFRWFTCGDVYSPRFFACMVEIARHNPNIKFWMYTKRYAIVNRYVRLHGGTIDSSVPKNLVCIFSHWMNKDGSYHDMNNPYGFATSEFIPIGKEELAKNVTYICPCSDPTVVATCATCEHPCFDLKPGESQALLEHSTPDSKKRDDSVKASKKALKEKAKAEKKALKEKARAEKKASKKASKKTA